MKNFFSAIDIFGTAYSFRSKGKERYQTALGGFVLFLFLVLVLVVGIYYFIPFTNRKNYTIVYYTMNLAVTEEVDLFKSQSNIAVGLDCEDNSNEKLSPDDLLEVTSNFVSYVKRSDNTYKKYPKEFKTHKCTYSDFYNKYDKQVDYLGLNNFECLGEKEDTIQGIFTDQIFSYFEFTVSAKNDSVLKEIDRFLYENDCKMQFAYNDIIIDLNNYKEPMAQYLNEMFIQLNPSLFIKRNIYFMNQYFTNDDYLLFVFEDKGNAEIKPLYSRYEEYSLYMGMERYTTRPHNYQKYAKIYIRADLKKTIIQRKYQKFMEFYADASSILIALYEIIYFVFSFINYFYAYHSLFKQIFFFKGTEDQNCFNIKRKKIEEIISLIESPNENNDINLYKAKSKESRNIPQENKKEISKTRDINHDNNQLGIEIYKSINTHSDAKQIKLFEQKEKKKNTKLIHSKILNTQKQSNNKYKYKIVEDDLNSEDFLHRKRISELSNNFDNNKILNINYNKKSDANNKNSKYRNKNILLSLTSNDLKKKSNTKINYSFNIFEIFITQFFKCCMCGNMTIKNNLNENANQILFKKLDIITYMRNMILFDIMNRILLDDDKKDIINFLCRPVISVKSSEKNEVECIYNSFKEKNFEKLTDIIKKLMQKYPKDDIENRLISIFKKHFENII